MKMERCPFAGWQLLWVAGSCCLLLIHKWQLPLNGSGYLLPGADLWLIFCSFFFFLTTEKGLAGVGKFPSWPNPFGVLKTFQVRKWTLLPARIRYSKHKTKIAPWEAWRAASLRPQDGEPLRGKPGELLPPPPGRWTPQRALPCNELSPRALTRAGPSRFSFGTSLLWPLQSCCDYGKGSWVWSKWQRALSKPSVWRCFPHWRDQCCNLTLPISNRSLCVHFSFLGSLVNLMTQYANGHNNKNHSVDIRS